MLIIHLSQQNKLLIIKQYFNLIFSFYPVVLLQSNTLLAA
jgi:hypothetical protein